MSVWSLYDQVTGAWIVRNTKHLKLKRISTSIHCSPCQLNAQNLQGYIQPYINHNHWMQNISPQHHYSCYLWWASYSCSPDYLAAIVWTLEISETGQAFAFTGISPDTGFHSLHLYLTFCCQVQVCCSCSMPTAGAMPPVLSVSKSKLPQAVKQGTVSHLQKAN